MPMSLASLRELAALYVPPTPAEVAARKRPRGEALAARVRAYLATIDPAVSGQRGHDRTYYAAGRLVRGFDLSPEDAFPYLAEWNQKCLPPWSDAELWHKLRDQVRVPGPRGFLLDRDPPPPGARPGAALRNYAWDEVQDGETTRKVKVGRRGVEVLDELLAYTGGWPRRVGKLLFCPGRDGSLYYFTSANELFAWIDWQYSLDGSRGFDWAAGNGALTQQQFFAVCQQACEAWDQVELFPHEPQLPGHFYFHAPPAGGDGKALGELVRRFSPSTPHDEDLIRAFFVTLFWGGPAGQRPVFLFEAEAGAGNGGRGAGKSTVAVVGTELVGGFVSLSAKGRSDEAEKRLLSPGGLTKRVALIDNLKSLRFSNQEIEGWITLPTISGKQMYTGEGSRPNNLLWVMTCNLPSLSKDMAQRSVVVRVVTPTYSPTWVARTKAFIDERRWAIAGDCLAELRRPAALPDGFPYSRWAAWEDAVLARLPDPAGLQAVLAERRGEIDDDDELAADVAQAVRELVQGKFFDPDRDAVLIPSDELVEKVLRKYVGKDVNKVHAMRWLYTINVPGLSRWRAAEPYRGALWRGPECEPDAQIRKWGDTPP